MSVAANTARLPELTSVQPPILDQLNPTAERIQSELASLYKELREVEQQIRVVKDTLYSLSVVFGQEAVCPELLELVHPRHRTYVRGLTKACKLALIKARQPCSVNTVCRLITEIDPTLLMHHRNPMASAMTVLRNFAKKADVVRKTENGKSVWQWINWDQVSRATKV